jgi:hypothetical protein
LLGSKQQYSPRRQARPEDTGIRPFGYLTSMVVTIGLWLVLAPAIGAVARAPGKRKRK